MSGAGGSSVKRLASASDDPRLRALSYALLAPSAHNSQPWLVSLPDAASIDLYLDRARTLPHADPLDRQLLISQGTFVELCAIALAHGGNDVRQRPFPEGTADALSGKAPVLRLELLPGAKRADPLFDAITTRHTNKRAYEPNRSLPSRDLDAIAQAASIPGCKLELITDARKVAELAELCRDAMAVDASDRARNEETAAWFRFDDEELAQKRDGFGIEQGGIGGFTKWIAETFLLSRASAADPEGSFAKKSVALTWEQAASASAFALLTTSDNTRSAQLAAGQSYVRAQLAAEARGIRTQPFSQLLQEYAAMLPLRQKLDVALGIRASSTPQMLFRLGYAEPTVHSPRRCVAALFERADGRHEAAADAEP